MRKVLCMCPYIPTVLTRTRIVMLRHTLETLKTTNTARIAHLALPNSEIITYGGGDEVDIPSFAPKGTWLLYPEGGEEPPADEPPLRVLVLDGNWSQTRRMLHRLPALRRLPRLSLKPLRPDRPRMRKQHLKEGMSTLEAIAATLSLLEGAEKGRVLDELYDVMAERVLRARGTYP